MVTREKQGLVGVRAGSKTGFTLSPNHHSPAYAITHPLFPTTIHQMCSIYLK